MSLIEIVEKVFGFSNTQVIEAEPEPEINVSPVALPYVHAHGFSSCYLTHEHTSVRRNGMNVRYYLVQDAYDGQSRWISEKSLIVNSWFTRYDGGVQ